MKKVLLLISLIASANLGIAQDTVFFKLEPTKPFLVSNVRYDGEIVYLQSIGSDNESKVDKNTILRIGYHNGSNKNQGQIVFPINSKGFIEYTEVVNLDSISADKIYGRAKMFISKSFNSAIDVVQNDDPINKQLLVKAKYDHGTCCIWMGTNGYVEFTMTIACKDNRYKYSIELGNHVAPYYYGGRTTEYGGGSLLNERPNIEGGIITVKNWNKIKELTDSFFRSYIIEMKKSIADNSQDDW